MVCIHNAASVGRNLSQACYIPQHALNVSKCALISRTVSSYRDDLICIRVHDRRNLMKARDLSNVEANVEPLPEFHVVSVRQPEST